MALAAPSLSLVYLSSPRPSLSISSHHHLHSSRHNITATISGTIPFEFPLIPSTRTTFTTVFSSLPTNPNSEHPNSTQPDEPDDEQPPPLSPLPSAKRSFAVATAEVVLGLASGVIKTIRNKSRGGGIAETAGSASASSSVSVGGDSVPSNGNGVHLEKSDYEERIGAVLEDSLESEVVWEQRVKDVEAEKRREKVTSPGFSFSAAGLLFPYHLGVAQCLMEKGYIKETTPLAGSSAGAIVCAAIASGRCMEETLQVTKQLAGDCRLKGTAFRLGAVLRKVLEESLPDDAHTRCNGRVRVAVTQISWRPRGLLVDQFDSKEDLINAVFTSSFVPGFLAPRPATMFRNQLCVDGGLTLFMPPTSADQTVRVCAFPASRFRLQGIGISPDCNPGNRPSIRQLFNWALEPAEDDGLDKLFEFGYMDASVWAEQNPLNSIIKEDEL